MTRYEYDIIEAAKSDIYFDRINIKAIATWHNLPTWKVKEDILEKRLPIEQEKLTRLLENIPSLKN
jgi:hypothetical protein